MFRHGEAFPIQGITVIASENITVIASINEVNAWQSPDLESETPTTGNLNDKEIATTAMQSRNDGIHPTRSGSGSLNGETVSKDAYPPTTRHIEPTGEISQQDFFTYGSK